jgi:hypothetical protein
MRDALDDLLRRASLVTIAAAIALGYALLNLAEGVSTLVVSIFTERDTGTFGGVGGGPLSLEVQGRFLEFGQLVRGVVTLSVVVAAILYVLRLDERDTIDHEMPETVE